MEAYRIDVVVEEDGTITIGGLPFRAGERLEVILLQTSGRINRADLYPLRGESAKYEKPFEGVVGDDWEAAN